MTSAATIARAIELDDDQPDDDQPDDVCPGCGFRFEQGDLHLNVDHAVGGEVSATALRIRKSHGWKQLPAGYIGRNTGTADNPGGHRTSCRCPWTADMLSARSFRRRLIRAAS